MKDHISKLGFSNGDLIKSPYFRKEKEKKGHVGETCMVSNLFFLKNIKRHKNIKFK